MTSFYTCKKKKNFWSRKCLMIFDYFLLNSHTSFNHSKLPITWIIHKLVIVLEFKLFNLIFFCFSKTFVTFSFILSYFCLSLIMTLSSPWLISMAISAWDTKVSMLSSLLLASIRILSCFFFLLLVILSSLFLLLKKTLK